MTTQINTLVGYSPDPNGRGTPTLVLSCVLTMVLCVWSALHLNVPASGQTKRQLVRLNIQWILAGIYAPELVVFSAWRQWSSARLLFQTIKPLYNVHNDEESKIPRRHPWTMTHSFFASTGGFAIDCQPYFYDGITHTTFLPQHTPKRLTLSARGIEFLAKRGLLPNVSKAEITDKSKADALGKTLVLLQALWMLIQVIGRLAAGLPVTLLEVNTVAHVLCALLMYSLWWYKPLLPREPILVSSPLLDQLLPFMYMSSEISGWFDKKQIRTNTAAKKLLASLDLYSKEPEIFYICSRSEASKEEASESAIGSGEVVRKTCTTRIELSESTCSFIDEECVQPMKDERDKKANAAMFLERRPRIDSDVNRVQSDSTSQGRLTRLKTVFQDNITVGTESFHHQLSDGRICRHFNGEELVCDHSRNWPSEELLRSVNGFVIGTILWSANFLYGAIHCAAWNDHFPSVLEKWLWRSSALFISFAGGLWVVANAAIKHYRPLDEFFEKWVDGEKNRLHYVWLGILVVLGGCSLVFARVYIVMGAFLSIRSLPQSAYDTPDWSQIFPHF